LYTPTSHRLRTTSPLWQRAPTRDRRGQLCIDFMLMIPEMKKHSDAARQGLVLRLRESLEPFESKLVYVDFNQRLGLIWVSLQPEPGIARVVTLAIQRTIPEARLVATQCHPDPSARSRRQRLLTHGRSLGRSAGQHLMRWLRLSSDSGD